MLERRIIRVWSEELCELMLGLNKEEEAEEVIFRLELGLEVTVDLSVHGFHERN